MEGKKVFLYNTHLDNIMNHPNEVIIRIKWVISLFQERGDCVLLWRPHPLSIETIKTMSPELLGEYLELIEEFKKLDFAVYDDTPDLQRAIYLSSAYIGDMSSLVALYHVTGKPMYLMDLNVEEPLAFSEFGKYAHFSCAAVSENKIYASSSRFNAFYIIDSDKSTVLYTGFFDGERRISGSLFQRTFLHKNRVYFIPYEARALHYYDCREQKLKKLYITEGTDYFSQFVEAFIFGDLLFLFQNKEDTIIILNLETGETEILSHVLAQSGIDVATYENIFSLGEQASHLAVVTSMCGPIFVELNLREKTFTGYSLEETTKENFIDVAIDGSIYYFLTVQGTIIKWDKNSGMSSIVWRAKEKYGNSPFARVVYDTGRLWLLPNLSEAIVVVAPDTGTDYEMVRYSNDIGSNASVVTMKCSSYYHDDGKLKIFPNLRNDMLTVDLSTLKITMDKIVLSEETTGVSLIEQLAEPFELTGKKQLYQEYSCPLSYFIDKVTEEDTVSDEKNPEKQGECGREIWNHVKRRVLSPTG